MRSAVALLFLISLLTGCVTTGSQFDSVFPEPDYSQTDNSYYVSASQAPESSDVTEYKMRHWIHATVTDNAGNERTIYTNAQIGCQPGCQGFALYISSITSGGTPALANSVMEIFPDGQRMEPMSCTYTPNVSGTTFIEKIGCIGGPENVLRLGQATTARFRLGSLEFTLDEARYRPLKALVMTVAEVYTTSGN